MSIISTISVFLLSNSIALNALLSRDYLSKFSSKAVVSDEDWEEWTRVASLQRDSGRPWHVVQMRWKKFRKAHPHMLLHALNCIGREYLHINNRCLFIKEHELFARWQNLRSRLSLLPIKYWMLYKENLPFRNRLVHPHSSCMAEYIDRVGLNECHLHLHACMPPELSWLMALSRLDAYAHSLMKADQQQLRALFTAVHPALTAEKMVNRMRLAQFLRLELLNAESESDIRTASLRMIEQYRLHVLHPDESYTIADMNHPCVTIEQMEDSEQTLWKKLFFWAENNVPNIDYVLFFAHLYLLIQNDFLQLCRMNESNKGLPAFRVRAHHSCFGASLSDYYSRVFTQMLKSSFVKKDTCIEIRITPAVFDQWAERLEQQWRSCCAKMGVEHPNLILTVHFLKRMKGIYSPWSMDKVSDSFAAARERLKDECGSLIKKVRSLCQRCDVGISIDGAGNELQFSPDIMAPIFRLFEQETGISYKTYHCGEDFYHLISGIRTVYEGVVFLELKHGNRIGHATAIGIPPKRWREDIPELLVVKQGEWLLNLIFAWIILSESNHDAVLKIEQAMLPIAMKIFEPEYCDVPVHVHSLSAFYDARMLDVSSLNEVLESNNGWFANAEEERVMEFREHRGVCGLKLYRHWLHDRYSISEQNKLIEVKRDFLDTDTLLLLQQRVQHLINKRNVVLEALPVSNVRISQYQDMRQHHILRWMGVPGHALPGDEVMTVCIGSDDPGIFVSDIKNEFYHIFANLRGEGLTPDECMKYIKRLNHAGRVYSFREKIIKDENYEFADWPTLAETMKSESNWF